MKGKAPNTSVMHLKAYAGGDSNVAAESRNTKEMFKKGGKVAKKGMKKDMKAEGVMSMAHAGRKPRKAGGGVFSSARAGEPRGKADHY
jgi:hypothetical protein